MTVNNVVVGSSTSLTANFVLDAAAALGARNGHGDDRGRDKRTRKSSRSIRRAARRR